MPRVPLPLPALAGLVALLLAPSAQAQSTLEARFNVSFAGLTGGQIALSANESGGQYVVRSQGRPTGLAGALVNYQYDGTTRGRISGGRYSPTRYQEREIDNGTLTGATITFQGNRPTAVAFDPPRPPEPHDIDPTAQSGVTDTLTALYLMMRPVAAGGACNQRYEVFDGRHVSRLSLGQPATGADGVITCAAEYRRLRGYSPAQMAERERVPMTVTYGPAPGGLVQILEIRAPSRLGDAVLRRQ